MERFGPPPVSKPTFFEKLRDRLAVRRALSRSSSSYDAVQIVSGSGAPVHTGRARLEVERRRQETLRMDPGAVPGDTPPADRDDKVDDLGPLPPTTQMVPSRGATRAPAMPGQMPLPGTAADASKRAEPATPRDASETFQRPVLGVPTPPRIPTPPPIPPARSAPDPLGQALSDFDRERTAGAPLSAEPRPWRPREVPEDEAKPHRESPAAAAATPSRRHSPSQLRESRRLLALFGGATLVMLVVGIVSGRTSTPLPSSTSTATTQQPSSGAPAQHSAAAQPGSHASSAPAAPANPAPQASAKPPAPASTAPTLTGTKVLGDSGTGYQVKDFRYGPHPGFFRVVMDFDASGAAAGTPKATVGFLDSTTLLVAVDGVVPAGSTGALPANGTVSSVTLLNPSPFPGATTYQIKLAHPVNLAASYLSGPLRLVIDLGG